MKTHRIKKIILITTASIIIIALIAIGTFNYYIKPKYISPMIGAVEELILEDQETIELILEEYDNTLKQDDQDHDESEENTSNQSDEMLDPSRTQDTDYTNRDNSSTPTAGKDKDKAKDNKVIVGGKTMGELQKEVSPGDLKTGLSIASKIDSAYLLSLSKGGLTPENKKEALNHINSRLSPKEFSQLQSLVGKYAYLLK